MKTIAIPIAIREITIERANKKRNKELIPKNVKKIKTTLNCKSEYFNRTKICEN